MKRERQNKGESVGEGNEDKLNDLPNCIILHILSYLNNKDVVRTCVLSTRWKNLWKCLLTFMLHSSDFRPVKSFNKFVCKLMYHRDDSIALHTLDFKRLGIVEPHILKRVVSYAISHNVQQLGIDVRVDISKLPPSFKSSIFSCLTLTSLKLSIQNNKYYGWVFVFPKFLNLPALTSMYLTNIVFCKSDTYQIEPFSTLNRLEILVMDFCYTLRSVQVLFRCSTALSSLTIRARENCLEKIVFSTPNLCSFVYEGVPCHDLTGSSLSSLKQVNIDADTEHDLFKPPLILLNLLKELANVQSLTVTVNTLQLT